MKVLIFYQYFGTPKGSWSTRIYEMTRLWVEKGHSVTVVTSPYEKSDIKVCKFITRMQIEGINLIVINSADSNRDSVLKRAIKSLIYSVVSCWFALIEKFEVVIASSGPITVGIPALLAKWFRNKKMIFEVRDLWPSGGIELGKIKNKSIQKIALKFEEICYRNSKFVVPCSKGMEKSINERFPKVTTLVIPNACDVKLFENKTPFIISEHLKHKKIILYAGSLGFMDNCEYIVEAMKLISNPEIQILFIGQGTEKVKLEEQVRKYKLRNIHFLGLIPKNDVVNWFSIAQASLVMFKGFTVLQTSSPNKLFDSFAAGVPVIQNTTGWIKDLVEKENCGINVPQNNPKKLAEAILTICSDKNYRDELAKNAKQLAKTEFNREILAQKYLESLLKLDKYNF